MESRCNTTDSCSSGQFTDDTISCDDTGVNTVRCDDTGVDTVRCDDTGVKYYDTAQGFTIPTDVYEEVVSIASMMHKALSDFQLQLSVDDGDEKTEDDGSGVIVSIDSARAVSITVLLLSQIIVSKNSEIDRLRKEIETKTETVEKLNETNRCVSDCKKYIEKSMHDLTGENVQSYENVDLLKCIERLVTTLNTVNSRRNYTNEEWELSEVNDILLENSQLKLKQKRMNNQQKKLTASNRSLTETFMLLGNQLEVIVDNLLMPSTPCGREDDNVTDSIIKTLRRYQNSILKVCHSLANLNGGHQEATIASCESFYNAITGKLTLLQNDLSAKKQQYELQTAKFVDVETENSHLKAKLDSCEKLLKNLETTSKGSGTRCLSRSEKSSDEIVKDLKRENEFFFKLLCDYQEYNRILRSGKNSAILNRSCQ